MISVLDAIKGYGDSADVYDSTYDDGGMGWVVEDEMADGDAYDRVVHHMAETIEVVKNGGVYSVVADIAGYVEASLDMWIEFGKEFNTDRAQISDDEEEGIYWGVRTVQNLACGMYSDEAYQWLEKRMFAQEGKE